MNRLLLIPLRSWSSHSSSRLYIERSLHSSQAPGKRSNIYGFKEKTSKWSVHKQIPVQLASQVASPGTWTKQCQSRTALVKQLNDLVSNLCRNKVPVRHDHTSTCQHDWEVPLRPNEFIHVSCLTCLPVGLTEAHLWEMKASDLCVKTQTYKSGSWSDN